MTRGSPALAVSTICVLAVAFLLIWLLPTPHAFRGMANYLPIHMALEGFSIVVAMLVFAVTWNAYSSERPGNVIIIACAMLAAGMIDFVHMLSFKGMPEFITPSGAEKAINFWLAARFLAAFALLVVAVRPWTPLPSPRWRYALLTVGLAITALVSWVGLFHQEALPRTFVDGTGLTPIKIGAEYLIVTLLIVPASIFFLDARRGAAYDAAGLFTAAAVSILSELSFTLYKDVTDIFNLLGHVYKVIAYLFIYRALFVSSVHQPFEKLKDEIAMRKSAQDALRLSRDRFRTLVDATSQIIWTTDAKGHVTDDIPSWRAYTGQTWDEVRGAGWGDALHPEDRQRTYEVWTQAVQQRSLYDIEYRLRRHDGEYRWFSVRGVPVIEPASGIREWIGSCTDITMHKRAEIALRAAGTYARSLIEASLDPLVTISPEGKITDVNEATVKVTGVPRQKLVGTDFSNYFTEPQQARSGYREVFEKGYVTDYPLTICHTSGRLTDVLYNASVYRDEAGTVLGVFAAARDVTERKRSEAAARRLAAIVESSEDAIISATPDGRISTWNAGAQRLYGYRAEEIVGRPILDLVPPERASEENRILDQVRAGKHVDHYATVRCAKTVRR